MEVESSETVMVDTFANVNTMLLERGCLSKPLDVSELSSAASKSLSNLLLSLLDQRQEQANFREQLASQLTVTESSLERTRKFWKEEQEKSADLARKLDTTKARVGTISKELSNCQSNFKSTKEELQKSKRDLLTVKQQALQHKQANDRQIERLRARFTDESIKLLRAKLPEVHFEGERSGTSSSARRSGSLATSLERKQIEELESRRRELMETNAALKRFATEGLNLARESAGFMNATMEQDESLASSSNSTSSTATIRPSTKISQYYQRDLFPASLPLQSDYSNTPTRGQKQHPAVESLSSLSALIHQRGARLVQTSSTRLLTERDERRRISSTKTQDEEAVEECSNLTVIVAPSISEDAAEREQIIEQTRLLNRALERVQELEDEVQRHQRDMELTQSRREDREERIKQAAEVEKQRQRYLSLCKELEEQEGLLREERQTLQRQKEEVLQIELSLSVQNEDSLASFNESEVMSAAAAAPLKRHRDEEKENESQDSILQVKKSRPDHSTPMGADTMRFVTIRKRRGRIQ